MLLAATAALAGRAPMFSLEVSTPVDVLDRFPLAVGTRWVYGSTYRTQMGQSKGVSTVTWTSEVEVVAHHDVPEGKVVERRVTRRDVRYVLPDDVSPDGRRWLRENYPGTAEPSYLVRGSYVYELPAWAWDSGRKALTDRRPGWVAGPEHTPAFFFPMSVGLGWAERQREERDLEQVRLFEQGKGGAPNPGMYYWVVEGRETVRVPYGTVPGAWHLRYGTVGGPEHVWFKEGLGVVKETSNHSGTLIEWETVLKVFQRARP